MSHVAEQQEVGRQWQEDFNAALTAKLVEVGARDVLLLHDEVYSEMTAEQSAEVAAWAQAWWAEKAKSRVPFTAKPVLRKEWETTP